MYRLTPEVANALLAKAKEPSISSLSALEEPFVIKDINNIGIIDPLHAYGTQFSYILEIPYSYYLPEANGTTLQGYWLYRKDELFPPSDSVSVPRFLLDPNVVNSEELVDVTDCFVVVPTEMEKLTCTMIHTLERLLELEPPLKECLTHDPK